MNEIRFDWQRLARTGVAEAVLADGKSDVQLRAILDEATAGERSVLLTRLSDDAAEPLIAAYAPRLDYEPRSRTAILDHGLSPAVASDAAVIASAHSLCTSASHTAFHGIAVNPDPSDSIEPGILL